MCSKTHRPRRVCGRCAGKSRSLRMPDCVDDHDLARLHLADVLRLDEVERGGLADARTQLPLSCPSTRGRKPMGSRAPTSARCVSEEDASRRRRPSRAPRARRRGAAPSSPPGRAPRARAMRWTITSVSVDGLEDRALVSRARTRSCSALTRLPLWATATAPPGVLDRDGLRVLEVGRAGGRVADVADGGVALERREHVGAEDVGDEPHLRGGRGGSRRRWRRCRPTPGRGAGGRGAPGRRSSPPPRSGPGPRSRRPRTPPAACRRRRRNP